MVAEGLQLRAIQAQYRAKSPLYPPQPLCAPLWLSHVRLTRLVVRTSSDSALALALRSITPPYPNQGQFEGTF